MVLAIARSHGNQTNHLFAANAEAEDEDVQYSQDEWVAWAANEEWPAEEGESAPALDALQKGKGKGKAGKGGKGRKSKGEGEGKDIHQTVSHQLWVERRICHNCLYAGHIAKDCDQPKRRPSRQLRQSLAH